MSVTQDSGSEAVLPRRRDLPSRGMGAEVLVRDPVTQQVHFLNPSAAVGWECADGRTTLGECEARLRAAFVIPDAADVAADIRDTLADFAQKGLLHDDGVAD